MFTFMSERVRIVKVVKLSYVGHCLGKGCKNVGGFRLIQWIGEWSGVSESAEASEVSGWYDRGRPRGGLSGVVVSVMVMTCVPTLVASSMSLSSAIVADSYSLMTASA